MNGTSAPHRRARTGRRWAAVTLLVAGLGLGPAIGASAIPPDGPGVDSPGTSSRVWPTTVKAGDRLNFEVSGYPANETVYIKIDDGLACSDTSHGACVFHTQKLDGNGYATGTIVVPNLAPGAHWLRMLATGDVFDAQTGQKIGYEGYTRRGGNDFTVVAGGSAGGSAPGSGGTNADGTIAGGSVSLDVEEGAAEGETPAEGEAGDSMDDITVDIGDSATAGDSAEGENAAVGPGDSSGGELPIAGIAVLAGAGLLALVGLGWALLRRRRMTADGAPPAG